MDFDFFEFLDNHMTRLRFKPETSTDHYYPSEASVQFYDSHGDLTTEGGCLRASYFRVVGGFEKVANSAYSEWIFKMGKLVEEEIVLQAKEAGIWVDNNIRFYDKEYNISGEIDLLIAEPPNGVIVPMELKTCYGYFSERDIFGNTKVKGAPKINQMVQLLVYLWKFRDQFPYGRMAYFFRDSTKRKTFKISLLEQGELIYPVVDGEVWKHFTVNDILKRYKQLDDYVKRQEVPPADYELQHSAAKIEDFFKKGKVAKTKYEAWKKGKLKPWEYIGNWNCKFCGWRKNCYPDIVDEPNKNSL